VRITTTEDNNEVNEHLKVLQTFLSGDVLPPSYNISSLDIHTSIDTIHKKEKLKKQSRKKHTPVTSSTKIGEEMANLEESDSTEN
jgi:hypothetical protein